uniref:Secreted protein n=1 Tax=Steinernema glaseri TaxID=37863 RepID=A0A1I8AH44_9BILA
MTLRSRALFLVVLLLALESASGCPGLFGGGGGGCCGCCGGCGGCGRRKREVQLQESLVLETPLRTENEHECPQNRWKTIMEKVEHVLKSCYQI